MSINFTELWDKYKPVLLQIGCNVKKLNDSSVDFAVRVWTENPKYWPAFFHITEHIKKAFDTAGIGIPFPQMDVHIKQPTS